MASASGQPLKDGPGQREVCTKPLMFTALALIALLAAGCDRAAAERQTQVERRLQRVEDELAIHRLLVDYSATQDARDYQAYAALFAREGEWVNGNRTYKGREAILQMLTELYGPTPPGYINNESYHITSNPQIDVDGDRATARSRHLLVMRGPKGEPVPMLAGRYEDELIREDGKWKILRRVDYPVMPTAEEWMQFIRQRRAGSR